MSDAKFVLLTLPDDLLKGSFVEYKVPAGTFDCGADVTSVPDVKKSANNQIADFSPSFSIMVHEKNAKAFRESLQKIIDESDIAVKTLKLHECSLEKEAGKEPVLLVLRQLTLFNYTLKVISSPHDEFSYQFEFSPSNSQKPDCIPGGRQRRYSVQGGKSTLFSTFYFDLRSGATMDKCFEAKVWDEKTAKDIT